MKNESLEDIIARGRVAAMRVAGVNPHPDREGESDDVSLRRNDVVTEMERRIKRFLNSEGESDTLLASVIWRRTEIEYPHDFRHHPTKDSDPYEYLTAAEELLGVREPIDYREIREIALDKDFNGRPTHYSQLRGDSQFAYETNIPGVYFIENFPGDVASNEFRAQYLESVAIPPVFRPFREFKSWAFLTKDQDKITEFRRSQVTEPVNQKGVSVGFLTKVRKFLEEKGILVIE